MLYIAPSPSSASYCSGTSLFTCRARHRESTWLWIVSVPSLYPRLMDTHRYLPGPAPSGTAPPSPSLPRASPGPASTSVIA